MSGDARMVDAEGHARTGFWARCGACCHCWVACWLVPPRIRGPGPSVSAVSSAATESEPIVSEAKLGLSALRESSPRWQRSSRSATVASSSPSPASVATTSPASIWPSSIMLLTTTSPFMNPRQALLMSNTSALGESPS